MFRAGDKWAANSIAAIQTQERNTYSIDDDGREYVSESITVPVIITRCDCGGLVTHDYKTFRKREHKDCGCGASGFVGINVMQSFSTSGGMKEHLGRYAKHHKVSVNYVVNAALRHYFECKGVVVESSVVESTGKQNNNGHGG